ncbi:putative inorganic phosphate cotransporter isoform X1 [Trichogramma pretiosum]|uniref:putative inorganic phosphate cotransporter isoform X1 n=1 Tax=Trichogramma pretiosum TaxID=7493 RepID=UPI0006C99422|nr:putative inorganic phosphate cotransporter isoform X1 [Trichogramma pretiosum]
MHRSSWTDLRLSDLRITQRWVFAILSFIGICLGYSLRAILSITITRMVPERNKDATRAAAVSNYTTIDAAAETMGSGLNSTMETASIDLSNGATYDWDEFTQGIILSSFYWGYVSTQFIYGILAERLGGKMFLGLGVLVPSLLTILTPTAVAYGGAKALIGVRVLMGMSNSAMYPSVSAMIPAWTTKADRTRFAGFIFAALIPGLIVGTVFPPLIIEHLGRGWPWVFYIFGAAGAVWFPVWLIFCYNKPSEHPFISETERLYLRQDYLDADGHEKSSETTRPKMPTAPFRYFLLSKEFWAFVISYAGHSWVFFTMVSGLPKYMNDVVGVSIESNGYWTAVSYLCMWLCTLASSWINDQLVGRGIMTRTNSIRALGFVSLTVPSFCILGASWAGNNTTLIVGLFVLGITMMGTAYPTIMINIMDLSPNYAGSLMAIGNGLVGLTGVFTPYVFGLLTPYRTAAEWRLVFWICLAVATLSNVYFLIFISGEVQKWNDPDYLTRKKNERNKQRIDSSFYKTIHSSINFLTCKKHH